MPVAQLTGVGVQGVRIKRRRRRFRRIPTLTGTQSRRMYWVFRDVSLTIGPGECVVLIDDSGDRAHTLMRVICGLLPPDEGAVQPAGRAILLSSPGKRAVTSLSVGQAVRLLGGLYGLSDTEIEERFERWTTFAGVDRMLPKPTEEATKDAIKQIAFTIGTDAPVDLVAIDSIAIVGSAEFRQQCLPRLREVLERGQSLVILTDETLILESLADRCFRVTKQGVEPMDAADAADDARRSITDRRRRRRRRRRAARAGEDDDDPGV